jgi:hypothetical protein
MLRNVAKRAVHQRAIMLIRVERFVGLSLFIYQKFSYFDLWNLKVPHWPNRFFFMSPNRITEIDTV